MSNCTVQELIEICKMKINCIFRQNSYKHRRWRWHLALLGGGRSPGVSRASVLFLSGMNTDVLRGN